MRKELSGLGPDKLKEKGRAFTEAFLSRLTLILKGSVVAPADQFGETLADEHVRGGGRRRNAITGKQNIAVLT